MLNFPKLFRPATQVNRIRDSIRSLDTFSARNKAVGWKPWSNYEMRQVSVDNFTVFYTIDKVLIPVSKRLFLSQALHSISPVFLASIHLAFESPTGFLYNMLYSDLLLQA